MIFDLRRLNEQGYFKRGDFQTMSKLLGYVQENL